MTRVFDINEITMSAYIQADGELTIFGRPLRLQAGVRYTDVDTDVTFTDRYSLVTTRGSSGTWKFLPSATAIFDVTDKLRLRRSEEHTSELQSLMRNSYAVSCLNKKHIHKL